jgi:hypothetical protein
VSSPTQVKTVLGQPALDYLKVCLAAGQSLVVQQALLLSERGYVWAYMPADFSDATNVNPEQSLSSAMTDYVGRGDSDVLLGRFVLQYLRGNYGRYAIFQDWNAAPNASVLMEWQDHYFVFRSEVYHFIHSTDVGLNAERIIDLMRRGYTANSRLNAGVLTNANDVPMIMTGQEITLDTMKALSGGVEHIVVDGFDGDREIIWSKTVPGFT